MTKTLLNFLLLISFSGFSYADVLLTGEIKAGDVQNFTVPWSETWRHQIKWMKAEGEIVEEGDLVVLFDTANLDSQIEQEKTNLRQSIDKAKNTLLDLEQKLIDAEHAMYKAQLEFDLAKLIADVPAKFRSEFEKDNIEFDLKKANTILQQSQITLTTVKASIKAEEKKQAIEVQRISAILEKKQNELNLMQLKAARKGAVLHASHPWNGNKISEGDSVQTSWNVASIPGMGNESVQAWVNEVDWPKLSVNQQVKLTLDAFPDDHFSGVIRKIGLQAESKNEWGNATYYDVAIDITQSSQQAIIPGMSVRIEVLNSNPEGSSDIEQTAGLINGGQHRTNFIEASGELESSDTVVIGPPAINNQWQFKVTFLAPEGTNVEAGAPVIMFDASQLNQQLSVKNSELKTSQKALENTQLTNDAELEKKKLEFAEFTMHKEKSKRKWQQSKLLESSLESKKLKIQYDIAANDEKRLQRTLNKTIESNKIKLAIAHNNVDLLQADLDRIQADIKRMTIVAPKSGIVIYKPDYQGNKVSSGDSVFMGRQLIGLPSLEKMIVKAEILEADAGKIRLGQNVELRLDAASERVFLGKVSRLGKVFRRKSSDQPNIIFDAEIDINKTDPELMRPGMAARLKIKIEEENFKTNSDISSITTATDTVANTANNHLIKQAKGTL